MTLSTSIPGRIDRDYDSPPQQPVQQQESEYLVKTSEEEFHFKAKGAEAAKKELAQWYDDPSECVLYVRVRD